MKALILAAMLSVGGSTVFVTGCDRTVKEEERTVSTPSGTVHQKDEIKEKADGTVTREKTETKTAP